MKQLVLILAASLFFCSTNAQQQYLPDAKAARELSAKSMKLFVEQKFSQGIEILRPYFPLSDDEIINLIEKTEESMPIVKERFGGIESATKISEKFLGETLLREAYTLNCGTYPLRFLYVYYKSKSGWLLISFKWDDEIGEELR